MQGKGKAQLCGVCDSQIHTTIECPHQASDEQEEQVCGIWESTFDNNKPRHNPFSNFYNPATRANGEMMTTPNLNTIILDQGHFKANHNNKIFNKDLISSKATNPIKNHHFKTLKITHHFHKIPPKVINQTRVLYLRKT